MSDEFTVNAIIHGHFYQPPREDPWIDKIDHQPSAYPFHNWNERITRECYGPNAFSRILDEKGRIINIINNYKYISFNFGPTLLNWMEKQEKEVYELILKADAESVKLHNGHGNAIAQVYNHVIMPLQNYEDKKTQIIWGLKDFEKRFSRKSEGIWLSETAIDYNTIDLLIDFDIKFVILSPDQARGFRNLHEDYWKDVSEEPINTNRVYKVIREHGEIAIFYYDKRISTAISFEHLLYSSENLANSIINGRNENDLVVIATDGEVYGHHEPFGDMCLAKLIQDYYIDTKRINLLNFGEYLELYPPGFETSIDLGEDGKGSSWSCIHGVGRWYRDCGCHTGGYDDWNQQWRTPLRESFDIVKEEIDKIYLNKLIEYTDEPWDLRNSYIDYILNSYNINNLDFLERHLIKKISREETLDILSLLESQKYAMFMYTSCAWFFTELTGIETVQNIKYAYKAIYVLGREAEYIQEMFIDKIQNAYSNISEFDNGKWIIENWVLPYVQDLPHIVNNYVALFKTRGEDVSHKFSLFESFGYNNFNLTKIKSNKYYEGKINVYDKRGYISKDYIFIYVERDNKDHKIFILESGYKDIFKKLKKEIIEETFNPENYNDIDIKVLKRKDLENEIKSYIIEHFYNDKREELINCGIDNFNDLKNLLYYYKNMDLPIPDFYKTFLRMTTESMIYGLSLNLYDFPDRELLIKFIQVFDLVNHFSINIDARELKIKISNILYNTMVKANEDLNSDQYKKALILVEFCNKVNLGIEKSRSENLIFGLLKKKVPEIIREIDYEKNNDRKAELILQYRNLIIFADNFNINTEKEKKYFFEHLKNNSSYFSY